MTGPWYLCGCVASLAAAEAEQEQRCRFHPQHTAGTSTVPRSGAICSCCSWCRALLLNCFSGAAVGKAELLAGTRASLPRCRMGLQLTRPRYPAQAAVCALSRADRAPEPRQAFHCQVIWQQAGGTGVQARSGAAVCLRMLWWGMSLGRCSSWSARAPEGCGKDMRICAAGCRDRSTSWGQSSTLCKPTTESQLLTPSKP